MSIYSYNVFIYLIWTNQSINPGNHILLIMIFMEFFVEPHAFCHMLSHQTLTKVSGII